MTIETMRMKAMTIHWVRIVELMLGYQTMSCEASGGGAEVRGTTTWGAGNSSVPWM
jgi:hypothetical protein